MSDMTFNPNEKDGIVQKDHSGFRLNPDSPNVKMGKRAPPRVYIGKDPQPLNKRLK
jgi:hypothetical protein